MNGKRVLSICLLVAAGLIASAACTRTSLEEPSPFGPSTFVLTFEVEARPNVILAGDVRSQAEIRAVVTQHGQPVKDKTVYFTVAMGPGEFGDYTRRTVAITDSSGIASVTYLSPTKLEIEADTNALIKVQPETSTSEYIHKSIEIRILKGE